MKLSVNKIIVGLSIVLSMGLTACSPVQGTTHTELQQDPKVTRSLQYDYMKAIQEGNVTVIQQGARLIFVLPINRFFKFQTFTINRSKVPVIEVISLYLRTYVKTHHVRYPIKVYAYTDNVPLHADRYTYSEQYAQVIASHLWSRGFTPQQLQVVGWGSENPIADNGTAAGSNFNRRVMIQVN